MNHNFPEIPNWVEVYAYCEYDSDQEESNGEYILERTLYRVVKFERRPGFMPYGVKVATAAGRVLASTYYFQRFSFFEIYLN